MMISSCPTCEPIKRNVGRAIPKLKYLRYVEYVSNTKMVLEEAYSKDPRPNFHAEIGYSSAPDSLDRFDETTYDSVVESIMVEELEFPPPYDDDDYYE